MFFVENNMEDDDSNGYVDGGIDVVFDSVEDCD